MVKANIAFIQFVNSIMASERIPHSEAWQRAAQLKPDLNTMMLAIGATRDRIQFFNTKHQLRCQQPSAASRIEARDEFNAKVHAYQEKYGTDYDTAYNRCQRQFSNDGLKNPAATGHGNWLSGNASTAGSPSDLGGTTDLSPTANSQLLALFFLPTETSQEVFRAAWEANGKQSAVTNPGKIFDGLVNFIMEAKKFSHDAAIDFCKTQYPKLWVAVKELGNTYQKSLY